MLIALIIFITSVLVGLGFWFYNKRRVTSLVDNIDDKQAIINALANHVESISSTNVENFVGESTTVTIEKDVIAVHSDGNHKGKNRKSNKNGYNKNKENKQKVKSTPAPEQFEKKNRPKPRKKNKPQQ